MFTIFEISLTDEDYKKVIERFDSRWLAEAYIDENDHQATDSGYVWIIGGSDEE